MSKKKPKSTNDQIDFLSGQGVDNTILEAAKKILLEAGYKVIKINVKTDVKTVRELKNYFYSRLYSKYPELYENRIDSIQRDMRMASLFMESRMLDKSVGKNVALQECVDIIDVIFDHEEEFLFKYPIRDISILGQGRLGWITQKAIEILNRERYKEVQVENERLLREMEDNMEIDFDEKSDKLSMMLARLEGNNG